LYINNRYETERGHTGMPICIQVHSRDYSFTQTTVQRVLHPAGTQWITTD